MHAALSQTLSQTFGKVKVPQAVMDVRWLSKHECLEAFYDSRHAILEYLTTFPADVDEESASSSRVASADGVGQAIYYPLGTGLRSLYFLPKDISDKIPC